MMKVDQLVQWIRTRKKVALTASAGALTCIALIVFFTYPKADSSWVRVRTHTFRHAVIDDGINSMNCMSGPWNECAAVGRSRRSKNN